MLESRSSTTSTRWSAFDTRNPPRAIGTGGIFDYLREQLPGFRIELTDHGAGAVSLLAVRGETTRVFNVHLDTVPSSPAWTADPLRLRVTGDRAIGLGACDIKGAAACLLAAAEATHGPVRLPVHQRRGSQRCALHRRVPASATTASREAIIAEPTNAQAVLAHRGIASVRMAFKGQAGPRLRRQCARAERRAPGDALGHRERSTTLRRCRTCASAG